MNPILAHAKAMALGGWRPLILQRDNHRCRACQATDILQLAHVTSTNAFGRRFGWSEKSVRDSCGEDNLVTLCIRCHGAQTLPKKVLARAGRAGKNTRLELIARFMTIRYPFSNETRQRPASDAPEAERRAIFHEQRIERALGKLKEWLLEDAQDAYTRRRVVARMFRQVRKQRGWNSTWDWNVRPAAPRDDSTPPRRKRNARKRSAGIVPWSPAHLLDPNPKPAG